MSPTPQFGIVIAAYFSGIIMHFYSWELVFYVFGTLGLVCFICFVRKL